MAAAKKSSFHRQLVLNRWMYRFFNDADLRRLKERLGDHALEGNADDGHTRYYHALTNGVYDAERITQAELLRYDIHIAEHWQAITAGRNRLEHTELKLKYFQYLSLLFTEIYLDRYFNRREELLAELNAELAAYNREQGSAADQFRPYESGDLNKLAFWNATGSGKTLLLHVNIRQYLQYFQSSGAMSRYPDKIILLTPSEALSRQHVEELALSGMLAGFFDKHKTSLPGAVDVIDINKLGDKMGDKTVAVEAFEGRNLVLVDEGHRGTGAADGAWMARREALCRDGFAFEYSATFGQAAAKGMTAAQAGEDAMKKKAKLLFQTVSLKKLNAEQTAQLTLDAEERRRASMAATREIYAKCILFDYSYKFFYEDGYGKESLILNLAKDEDPELRRLYLTACLLSFYQQQYLWRTHRLQMAEFNIERPLWVFVGNKVNDDDSDLLAVMDFLASFLNNEAQSKLWIQDLIQDKARLLDGNNRNIFERRFTPLMGITADHIFRDIVRTLFNSDSPQRLKVVNLKGSKGELLLRMGDAEPFGLINIGDDSSFFSQCGSRSEFDTETDNFGSSIFGTLNHNDSRIHLLIGSRKFTEGWSSWRVSTMGLLHMGRGEGSQIIQLFGRGVRLKGKDYSLKRTTPAERPKGLHLEKLETLNIFGVRADYMAQFKEYLREEGVTPGDEMLQLDFPARSTLGGRSLKTLSLQDGYKDNQRKGFKRTLFPVLYDIPDEFAGKIKKPHVVLDLYPKLQAMRSDEKRGAGNPAVQVQVKEQHKLPAHVTAVFDFDRIYMALQESKLRRGWTNLRISRGKLAEFCARTDWYTLYIPASELVMHRYGDVRKLEDILIRLLLDYTDRYYKTLKNAYEGQFYEIVTLQDDDQAMVGAYRFEIEPTDEGEAYLEQLKVLKDLVAEGRIGEAGRWNANHMVAICFDRHLYYPLLHIADQGQVPLKMSPLALEAPSETRFVRDLEKFYGSTEGSAIFGDRSLYLLRNADTKSKGLGFALAGNFYPDFLLWLVNDRTGEQWLSFVDPKGIRNLDLDDPKFGLYREVKTIESKLGDPKLTLNAFIVSETPYNELINIKGKASVDQLERQHVLFMDDPQYVAKLFAAIGFTV